MILAQTSTYPPFAIIECVPIITLLTLDMTAKMAESGIKMVLMLSLAKEAASSWPCQEKKRSCQNCASELSTVA